MYPRVLVIYVWRVSEEEPMDVHIFNFIYYCVSTLYVCDVSHNSLSMCTHSTLCVVMCTRVLAVYM